MFFFKKNRFWLCFCEFENNCLVRCDHSAVAKATLYLLTLFFFVPLEGKPKLRRMTRTKQGLPVLCGRKECLAESQRSVERRQWPPPKTTPPPTPLLPLPVAAWPPSGDTGADEAWQEVNDLTFYSNWSLVINRPPGTLGWKGGYGGPSATSRAEVPGRSRGGGETGRLSRTLFFFFFLNI